MKKWSFLAVLPLRERRVSYHTLPHSTPQSPRTITVLLLHTSRQKVVLMFGLFTCICATSYCRTIIYEYDYSTIPRSMQIRFTYQNRVCNFPNRTCLPIIQSAGIFNNQRVYRVMPGIRSKCGSLLAKSKHPIRFIAA